MSDLPAGARDPLAVGLGALATGVGLGGGCVTLTLLLVRLLQRVEIGRYGESVSEIDPIWGILVGIGVSTLFGWRRSRPLENVWQRGVISVLAVFGALFLALLAAAIWHFLRFAGLLALTAGCFGLGVAGSHWALAGAGGRDATGGGPGAAA
ncbi:MAG TPA: hypothetical protein VEU55_10960 [Gemmatimonadales bacterium]|nr:hypothetical protein [Gemmatimonadales bacterium]